MLRIVVILSTLFAGPLCWATTVDYHDLERVAQSPEARRAVAQLDLARDRQRPDDIAALLRVWITDDRDTLREHVLVEGAVRLAQLAPTDTSHLILTELAQRPTAVWVSHHHAGRAASIPAYDPAAAARYALAMQKTAIEAATLAASIKSGTAPAAKSGAIATHAVGSLNKRELRRALPALAQSLETDRNMGAAVIVAAKSLQDTDALATVIERGHAADAHAALSTAAQFDGTLHPHVLDAALARPATRSAALYQLARDIERDPGLTPRLLAQLDDPARAMAAAAAIARLNRHDIAEDLSAQLATETRPARANALALALMLMRNDAAQTGIDAYLDNPAGLPELKSKMAARRSQVSP